MTVKFKLAIKTEWGQVCTKIFFMQSHLCIRVKNQNKSTNSKGVTVIVKTLKKIIKILIKKLKKQ